MSRRPLDLTGKEHDGARVLHVLVKSPTLGHIWAVRCACGEIFEKRAAHIGHAIRGTYHCRLRCAECTLAAQRAGGVQRARARWLRKLADLLAASEGGGST